MDMDLSNIIYQLLSQYGADILLNGNRFFKKIYFQKYI